MFERGRGVAALQLGPGLEEPTLTATQAVQPGPLGQQASHGTPRPDLGLGPCRRQHDRGRGFRSGLRQFRGEKSARREREPVRQQAVGAIEAG